MRRLLRSLRPLAPVAACAAVALTLAACGQRLPLPTPPAPPPIPTNQYIVDAQWTGYAGVTDLLLTRYAFGSALLVVRDSAVVESYYPGSQSNKPQLTPNTTVAIPSDSLVRPVHIAEGVDGSLYVADAGHVRPAPDDLGFIPGVYDASVTRFTADGRTVLGHYRERTDRHGFTLFEWKTMDGVAVDGAGNVFVSGQLDSIYRNDEGTFTARYALGHVVRRYAAANNTPPTTWTVPGSARARSAAAYAAGMFADSTGLLVADRGTSEVPSRVLKLSVAAPSSAVESFGGDEGFIQHAAQPAPGGVTDVTTDNEGNIYFADPVTHRVLRFDAKGATLLQLVNEPGQVPAGNLPLSSPVAVAASLYRAPGTALASGRVFVADPATDRIVRYVFQP